MANVAGSPPFGRAGASGGGTIIRRPSQTAESPDAPPAPAEHANGATNDPGLARHQRRISEQRRLLEIVTAITKDPRSVDGVAALAAQLGLLGQRAEALAAYRKVAALDPARDEAKHAIAALSGAEPPLRAADGYVVAEFDRLADRYDDLAQHWWGSAASGVLADEITALLGPRTATEIVVDLGCGTGLTGERFRMMARKLEGVDVSGRMLEGAQARGIYDTLTQEEITRFLVSHRNRYTIAVAADVISYFGELIDLFRVTAKALKPSGLFAFTVERFEEDGFELRASGRYAHSDSFIRQVAQAASLEVRRATEAVLRIEHGAPVAGRAYVLERRL